MSNKPRIFAGSDHAGYELKAHLVVFLRNAGYEVSDIGVESAATPVDYPDIAHKVAQEIVKQEIVKQEISKNEGALGLLVCGSGIGMSIAANRHQGVRACVCSESYSAAMSRAHNNANILCLGSRVVGLGAAEHIVSAFLQTTFDGGRHTARVHKIDQVL